MGYGYTHFYPWWGLAGRPQIWGRLWQGLRSNMFNSFKSCTLLRSCSKTSSISSHCRSRAREGSVRNRYLRCGSKVVSMAWIHCTLERGHWHFQKLFTIESCTACTANGVYWPKQCIGRLSPQRWGSSVGLLLTEGVPFDRYTLITI